MGPGPKLLVHDMLHWVALCPPSPSLSAQLPNVPTLLPLWRSLVWCITSDTETPYVDTFTRTVALFIASGLENSGEGIVLNFTMDLGPIERASGDSQVQFCRLFLLSTPRNNMILCTMHVHYSKSGRLTQFGRGPRDGYGGRSG